MDDSGLKPKYGPRIAEFVPSYGGRFLLRRVLSTLIGVRWQSVSPCTFLGSCAPVIQRFADSCEQNRNGGSADSARDEEVASRLPLVPMCLWRAALVLFTSFPLSSHLFSVLAGCTLNAMLLPVWDEHGRE